MKYKRIHFVGIKGVGMTPLAIIAKEAGAHVTGADVADEYITDKALKKAGITVFPFFSTQHIDSQDLIIATGAHGGLMNPEVVAAKEKGIPVLLQGQAVGVFMEGKIFGKKFTGISVAGSHGKTTTTAMIATILTENKRDPSYVVGTSEIASLGLPGHFGKGTAFVAEADEYATEPTQDKTPKFLWQHPRILVITNIEFDHPDVYASMEEITEAFTAFTKQLPEKGLLVVCGDDPHVQEVLKEYTGNVVTYGFSPRNNFVIKRVRISGLQTFFWVEHNGVSLGQFTNRVTGEHNTLNSVASMIVCQELGLSVEECKKGLLAFTGTKRRSEIVGNTKEGALLIDDYAHHPTEIKNTLHSLKLSYPTHRIITIFQPHTYSRTKKLFHEFSQAFTDADALVIMDIFPSARESIDPEISSELLTQEIKKTVPHVRYLPTVKDVLQYLESQPLNHNTIILTMGAGDVYQLEKTLRE